MQEVAGAAKPGTQAGVRQALQQLANPPHLPIAPLSSLTPTPLSELIRQRSGAGAQAALLAQQAQQAASGLQQWLAPLSLTAGPPTSAAGGSAGGPEAGMEAPLPGGPSAEDMDNGGPGAAAGRKRKADEAAEGAKLASEDYQLFISSEFHRIKQEQPGLGSRDVLKLAVQAWQQEQTNKRQRTQQAANAAQASPTQDSAAAATLPNSPACAAAHSTASVLAAESGRQEDNVEEEDEEGVAVVVLSAAEAEGALSAHLPPGV